MPDHTPTDELPEPAQDGTMTLPMPGSAAGMEGAQAGDLSETGVLSDHSPRFSLLHIALFCILLTGFLLRLSAAKHLSSHVDESASIMAAKMVADRGVPIFPSGTLYLQGATISYILAPIIKLGYGGFDDLFVMRMLSVITGDPREIADELITH
ncbi:MAG TPA: hypothetical protein PK819_02160, partial [Thermomicrobiales bacterium]|nr:hypothetical protein [Thermomicrobiales bacterium]